MLPLVFSISISIGSSKARTDAMDGCTAAATTWVHVVHAALETRTISVDPWEG